MSSGVLDFGKFQSTFLKFLPSESLRAYIRRFSERFLLEILDPNFLERCRGPTWEKVTLWFCKATYLKKT
jgi:hypothetical protein